MKTARDVMEPPSFTVEPGMPVAELARILHDRQLDGVCVVQDGALVGVVTAMDLVFKEKRLHLPTMIYFLDIWFPLELPGRQQHEAEKIAAAKVDTLMTRDVVTAAPGTPLEEVASWMVEQHLSLVPVVEGGKLVGVITKPRILQAAFGLK
jgi:predicted transcriptional regulator